MGSQTLASLLKYTHHLAGADKSDGELLQQFVGRADDAGGSGVAGGGQDHVDELLA